jgi:single-stranded DNA-specific DHH superfamily exonuclease
MASLKQFSYEQMRVKKWKEMNEVKKEVEKEVKKEVLKEVEKEEDRLLSKLIQNFLLFVIPSHCRALPPFHSYD